MVELGIILFYILIVAICCMILTLIIANGVYLGIRWAKERESRLKAKADKANNQYT